MNSRKLLVLLAAAGAAGVIALMVRGLMGGGTKPVEAKPQSAPLEITQVLVASTRLDPGKPLSAAEVRWQAWPTKALDSSFIRQSPGASVASVTDGMVVRAPMVPGEPVTLAKIVKGDGAGYMAATLAPGMRAISIPVSVASIAGGFILPNNRVDVILTTSDGAGAKRAAARIVSTDVRVVAIDQAADKPDQKPVGDAKTVTLEVTPEQAQTIASAQAMGTIQLALRGLGDDHKNAGGDSAVASASSNQAGVVIRYGYPRALGGGGVQ